MERVPFAIDEWYHCYSRGIDKIVTFTDNTEYERFVQLLYVCNSEHKIHRSDIFRASTPQILSLKRGAPLVSIGAFSLMPTHFHLLLKEVRDDGISTFMQRLGTAYAMYFNIKHERVGSVFAKPFRAKRIAADDYFQHVLQYIHCNPAELYEPGWKTGHVSDENRLIDRLLSYAYGSFGAFRDPAHPLRPILGTDVFEVEQQSDVGNLIQDARAYYTKANLLTGVSTVKATP